MRTLALSMTLLLQLFSGFSPGGAVLCVHDDGNWFLESVATLCCRVCPRAEPRPEGAIGGSRTVARDRDGGENDHCQDYMLGAPDARTLVVKVASTELSRQRDLIGPAPALAVASVLPRVLALGEGTRETGPPLPPDSLALLRTVHLRC